MTAQKEVGLKRYMLIFSAVYAIGIAVTAGIAITLELESNSGVSVAILIAAAYYSSMRFINENKRSFTKNEKTVMVWSSMALSFLISFFTVILILMISGGTHALNIMRDFIAQLPFAIWAGVFALVFILSFVVLYLVYGVMADKYFKKVNAI